MVTMARSKNIRGSYESNPANPVLTNANTTSLCKFFCFFFLPPNVSLQKLILYQSKPLATPTSSKINPATGGVLPSPPVPGQTTSTTPWAARQSLPLFAGPRGNSPSGHQSKVKPPPGLYLVPTTAPHLWTHVGSCTSPPPPLI